VARWKFGIGEFFETLTKGELDASLSAYRDQARADEREAARGVKYMRLNPPVTGQAVGSVLKMGGDFITGTAASGGSSTGGQPGAPTLQPRAGYCWAVRRAAVQGLTNGTTPDIVNLFRRQSDASAWLAGPSSVSGGDWQFTGNNFAYTYSFGQLVFWEAETPIIVSQGTFAATGQVTFRMDFEEVPQLEIYKALGR
jgi:hypothetical protein